MMASTSMSVNKCNFILLSLGNKVSLQQIWCIIPFLLLVK